jgi:hypothetical protein
VLSDHPRHRIVSPPGYRRHGMLRPNGPGRLTQAAQPPCPRTLPCKSPWPPLPSAAFSVMTRPSP